MPFNEIQALDPWEDFLIAPEVLTAPMPKTGTQVTIYKDPFFKTQQEDTATLGKVLMSDGQRDLCLVTLGSNGMQVERWIKKDTAQV